MIIFKKKLLNICLMGLLGVFGSVHAELKPYVIPDGLVRGAQFIDLFLPMPIHDGLESNLWGDPVVIPRDMHNGIEDPDWSYWGGNALLGPDGKYYLFLCRWLEDSPKGHAQWRDSQTVYATADKVTGPYSFKGIVGPGHNPEIYQIKDGSYMLGIIEGMYSAKTLTGPWTLSEIPIELRGTSKTRMSNMTFTQRPDGSTLMISRVGHVFISKDGKSPYNKLTTESIYPKFEARFEDPVVWRSHNQYHLMVNNWYGRKAYSMRSLDGIHWIHDPGLGYDPSVAVFEDGTQVGWHKFERSKVIKDSYGRATHMNFAVVDVVKQEDLCNDNHSSKNIVIPIQTERLIRILNQDDLASAPQIVLEIEAEENFNPLRDIDLATLRFGASEVVNFGKGCTVVSHKAAGKNLIVTFNTKGHGFTGANFSGKLLGETKNGALVYGYALLPGKSDQAPALMARAPKISVDKSGQAQISVMVDNFGLKPSTQDALLELFVKTPDGSVLLGKATLKPLAPYANQTIVLQSETQILQKGKKYDFEILINGENNLNIFKHKVSK